MSIFLRPLFAALSAFCLLLCPLAAHGAEASTNPLAATGLLAHESESAEDLLLRAHQRDIPAMLLVAAGYGKGVGGFPQDRYIAAAWITQLSTLGAVDEVSLAALLLWEEEFGAANTPEVFSGLLANCEFTKKTPHTAALKKAGLFDAESFCAEREKTKKDFPGWQERSRANIETMERIRERSAFARTLVRELRTRPATKEDKEGMLGALQYASPQAVLFFAATTHAPETQRPDWSAERLQEFFLAQSPMTPDDSSEEESEAHWTFQHLVALAGHRLIDMLSEPPAKTLEAMRTAHSAVRIPFDDNAAKAMHTLARSYREGENGFVRDAELGRCWLQHAAFGGDAASMLALALHMLDEASPAEAWVWATMAAETGKGEAAQLGKAAAERMEKALGEEQMVRARELQAEYRKEKTERMKRYTK